MHLRHELERGAIEALDNVAGGDVRATCPLMPSRMDLTDYTTPTSVSFRYSPLMSAMTCSAGQRSAGSECRDDKTAIAEIPCEIESGIVVASKPEMIVGGFKRRKDDHALTRARGVSATAPAPTPRALPLRVVARGAKLDP